jgi:Zn-dependent protease
VLFSDRTARPYRDVVHGILIGRVRGIEIRIHWSLGIIGWLIAWTLATRSLPDMVEGRSDVAYWSAGIIATVGLLAALLAHEMGHSLVALRHGVEVQSITLWMLGGVARLVQPAATPGAAIRIAAAGPVVSLGCGLVGLVAGALTADLVSAVLVWFGSVNLLLALFNLLPALPLDGGRIYQAWLWNRGLSSDQATVKAARLGGNIGRAMVWLGVLEAILLSLLGGIWLMAIGWFIREASEAEAYGSRRESALRPFTCADVMTAAPACVSSTSRIDQLVRDVVESGRHAAYPVVEGSRVVGLIDVNSVRRLPPHVWPQTEVAAVMKPLADVPVVTADETADKLIHQLDERAATRALVMEGGRLLGIVSPSDVVRLAIAAELAGESDAASTGPNPDARS